MSASSIRRRLLHRGYVQGCLYTESPSRQTIHGCVCNGLKSTESNKLIGTKLFFRMNPASICGTMIAAFVLDAMPENAAFQAQHMQLLPWPAYSLDMSPIEHVWDLVNWRLVRDSRQVASKDELLLPIQAIWNSLPQAGIQNLFNSMLCSILQSM
ncbi:transposable element Tcb2 transposase [Trichonephila clavipes]|nr:transposable element Tcb2 transposase [Trichonephila clavipes]